MSALLFSLNSKNCSPSLTVTGADDSGMYPSAWISSVYWLRDVTGYSQSKSPLRPSPKKYKEYEITDPGRSFNNTVNRSRGRPVSSSLTVPETRIVLTGGEETYACSSGGASSRTKLIASEFVVISTVRVSDLYPFASIFNFKGPGITWFKVNSPSRSVVAETTELSTASTAASKTGIPNRCNTVPRTSTPRFITMT